MHACWNSLAERWRSTDTPVPSAYITPRLRQASRSPVTHLWSKCAAISAGSRPPSPVPASSISGGGGLGLLLQPIAIATIAASRAFTESLVSQVEHRGVEHRCAHRPVHRVRPRLPVRDGGVAGE